MDIIVNLTILSCSLLIGTAIYFGFKGFHRRK